LIIAGDAVMHISIDLVFWFGVNDVAPTSCPGSASSTTDDLADDVGSAFYCTIFDILEANPPMLEHANHHAPSKVRATTTRSGS